MLFISLGIPFNRVRVIFSRLWIHIYFKTQIEQGTKLLEAEDWDNSSRLVGDKL